MQIVIPAKPIEREITALLFEAMKESFYAHKISINEY
jgi:hypothetical protein